MGGVRARVGGMKVGPFELCILKICRPFYKSHTLPIIFSLIISITSTHKTPCRFLKRQFVKPCIVFIIPYYKETVIKLL